MFRSWSRCFEARLNVIDNKFSITLPLIPNINITSITPSISNWIEIHGIIDEKQELTSIPYIRNGSPDRRASSYSCSPCSNTTREEEEGKKAKTETLA